MRKLRATSPRGTSLASWATVSCDSPTRSIPQTSRDNLTRLVLKTRTKTLGDWPTPRRNKTWLHYVAGARMALDRGQIADQQIARGLKKIVVRAGREAEVTAGNFRARTSAQKERPGRALTKWCATGRAPKLSKGDQTTAYAKPDRPPAAFEIPNAPPQSQVLRNTDA